MDRSRQLSQRTGIQNALSKSKLSQWRMLDDITANRSQMSSLLTIVSTVKIKVLLLCWFISAYREKADKRKRECLCHKQINKTNSFFLSISYLNSPRVKPHAWKNCVTAVYSPHLRKAGTLWHTATTGQPDVGGWIWHWDTRGLTASYKIQVFLWYNSDCQPSKS